MWTEPTEWSRCFERAAKKAVNLDPFREAGYRRLMLFHAAAGNRPEVLRVYAKLAALLDRELKTIPGPETRRLLVPVAATT